MESQEKNQANISSEGVGSKMPIPETFLLGILTFIGYLSAFAYQYFYLRYFGIPWVYVEINLKSVLFVSLILVSCFSALIFVSSLLTTWNPKTKFLKGVKSFIAISFVMLGVGYISLAVVYEPGSPLLSLLGFLAILTFIFIQIFKEKESAFDQKSNELISKFENRFGAFYTWFIFALIIVIAGGVITGLLSAKGKSDFLISNTTPEVIVITPYLDGFVGVPVNLSTRTFNKEVVFMDNKKISEEEVRFVNKKIGPLVPLE